MNIQQLKKSGWIIHECIVGSHLYGTIKEAFIFSNNDFEKWL